MRARESCNRRDRRREYPDSGQLLRWVSEFGVRRRRPLNATACSRYWHCAACHPPCAAWHRPDVAHPSCRPGASRPARGQLRHGRRRLIGRTPAQRNRACRRCARTRRLIEQAFQCLQAHALFVDGALLSGERQLVLVLRAKMAAWSRESAGNCTRVGAGGQGIVAPLVDGHRHIARRCDGPVHANLSTRICDAGLGSRSGQPLFRHRHRWRGRRAHGLCGQRLRRGYRPGCRACKHAHAARRACDPLEA